MKAANVIISAAVGISLLTGSVMTSANGVSKEDMACYDKAVSLQQDADSLGFEGFELSDYPVVFCDGSSDYVVKPDRSTEKRDPVFSTLAATAYDNNGHFEVIVPVRSTMGTLSMIMGGEWDEAHQASTIWHEAFHCYQLTNYRENIEGLTEGHIFSEDDFSEKLINDEYAKNTKAKELLTSQLELLAQSAEETDIDKLRENMIEYKKIDEQRRQLISEDAQILEDYYTVVEGSAYYVEMNMTKAQSEETFEKEYSESLGKYKGGSAKYYSLGGAQCLVLDRIDSGWKDSYDFSKPVIEIIYEKLGV
ncbi:MAG: hypothetical protein J6M17_02020 [Ruminococcus sp.]|nr:hypothetical protein [Ruminococcus sp.]